MKKEDIDALIEWLKEKGYSVGNMQVAESLRQIADYWDD